MSGRLAAVTASSIIALTLLVGCVPGASCDLLIVGTDDPNLQQLPADALPVVVGDDVDPSGWAVVPDDGVGGGDQVIFRLRPDAAERFAAFTRGNIGRSIAIAVDDRVVAVPTIMAAIEDGEVAISVADPADLDGFRPCLSNAPTGR